MGVKLRGWDNVFRPTYGQGDLGRIYERLRKRAYRAQRKADRLNEAWNEAVNTGDWKEVDRIDDLLVGMTISSTWERNLYLQGVKDALNGVYDDAHELDLGWEG